MLQEQNAIKEDIAIKQKRNNDAINTIANKQQLEDDAQALSTEEAEQSSTIELSGWKSTAENEKNAFVATKAEAEKQQQQQLKQLIVQNKKNNKQL